MQDENEISNSLASKMRRRLSKLWRRLWSTDNVLHSSQFVSGFMTLVAVVSATFLFPARQAHYQRVENDLKLSQEFVTSFSNSIIKTVDYFNASTTYACRLPTKAPGDNEKKSDEYYDKFLSVAPPYPVSCDLVGVYFDPDTAQAADDLKKKIEKYLEEYETPNERSCEKKKEEAQEILGTYDEIRKKMIAQIQLKASEKASEDR